MRDSQRTRVYTAESTFILKDPTTLNECQEFVDSILITAWWRHRSNVKRIKVMPGARGGRAWAYPLDRTITTSPSSRTKWIMLHELAHHLTTDSEVASHGPEYCANYVALVRQFLDKERGDALKASFREHRVKVRGAKKPKVYRVLCVECRRQISGQSWTFRQTGLNFCTKRCVMSWVEPGVKKVA